MFFKKILKLIVFLFRDMSIVKSQWKKLRNSHTKDEVLILGNGPTVNELDFDKCKKWLEEKNKALFFANAFLAYEPFLTDAIKSYYLIADPDLFSLLIAISEGATEETLLKECYDGTIAERLEYPEYNSSTIEFDIRSLFIGLKRRNMTWIVPIKFKDVLNRLGIDSIILISPINIPTTYPLFIKKLFLNLGFMKPYLINCFGPSVISYGIISALELGFQSINILGHADNIDYSNYKKVDESTWSVNYRYFWDDGDRWINRTDSSHLFFDAIVKNALFEKSVEKVFSGRLNYISRHHPHYYFINLCRPDIFKD